MSIRKTVELPGERKLVLSIGNILEEPVEAIVNAANEHLEHGGGVAAAIAQAAGEELMRQSREHVDRHGPVKTGSAAVTTAGNLPYQGVIHAVGPVQGSGDEENKLTSAVKASCDVAAEKDWRSIAMPAISSGIFRVPLEICARSYVNGVRQHLEEMPDSSLKEIRITLFEGPIAELIEKEMDRVG